jgi:hypothetical protein
MADVTSTPSKHHVAVSVISARRWERGNGSTLRANTPPTPISKTTGGVYLLITYKDLRLRLSHAKVGTFPRSHLCADHGDVSRPSKQTGEVEHG